MFEVLAEEQSIQRRIKEFCAGDEALWNENGGKLKQTWDIRELKTAFEADPTAARQLAMGLRAQLSLFGVILPLGVIALKGRDA